MNRILIFIVFLFSFAANASGTYVRIGMITSVRPASFAACGIGTNDIVDLHAAAACVGGRASGGGSKFAIYFGNKRGAYAYRAGSACPAGESVNENGVCKAPPPPFCESPEVNSVRDSARAACLAPKIFTPECDNEKEQFLSSCVDDVNDLYEPFNPFNPYDPNQPYSPTNPYDPSQPYDPNNKYDPRNPDGLRAQAIADNGGFTNAGGNGGLSGGGGGNGGAGSTDGSSSGGGDDLPCLLNCDDESKDPTKTYCSSAAAVTAVNVNKSYCAMRAGNNTFEFKILSCDENARKVKTDCDINWPDPTPDPTPDPDPTPCTGDNCGGGTTDPDPTPCTGDNCGGGTTPKPDPTPCTGDNCGGGTTPKPDPTPCTGDNCGGGTTPKPDPDKPTEECVGDDCPHGLSSGMAKKIIGGVGDAYWEQAENGKAVVDDAIKGLANVTPLPSSTLDAFRTAYYQMIPNSTSCTPLTLGASYYAFTITCEFSDKFKSIFSFLIYMYTVLTIINIVFSGITPKGSPQGSFNF